ncbi:hypothetical protein [Pseudosulfitobacter koreensis]|uniref:Uncharacterized protein n=1 Tax=Pseudosulfitobacter koreensis TaxID=2968472 RepID=A0ABT1Z2C7_9RHOB|nr:hypothetical protein [Pseudosulfitobacter koreense]MCR8827279.1 hypothetical protein [Pseudosulfitobacter koreense]
MSQVRRASRAQWLAYAFRSAAFKKTPHIPVWNGGARDAVIVWDPDDLAKADLG